MEIEADYVEIEDKLGVAVYRGNVVVTQGTIRFTGNTLTVTYTPGQEIKEALLEGQPATFKQRPDNEDTDMEGEALNMRYEVQKELVHLVQKAKVTQKGQTYTGHRMVYDRVRNILTAFRAEPGEVGAKGQPPERVRIIIPPKPRDEPRKKPK
jgi:lipopolysaccharide export system protein LptA